jgi:hypothetical protein
MPPKLMNVKFIPFRYDKKFRNIIPNRLFIITFLFSYIQIVMAEEPKTILK